MADSEFHRGDNWTLNISVTDSGGAAVDLSDAQASEYGIFDGGGIQVVTKQLGSGISIAANIVTVTLEPADTSSLAPGTYIQELEVIDALAAVHTVYQGDVLLKRDYIHSEEG